MKSRFNQQKANLRAFLRKRGAEIDVKCKTIKIDVDSLDKKETEKLRELERWGYQVKDGKIPHPKRLPTEIEEDSFIAFADEIIEQYFY